MDRQLDETSHVILLRDLNNRKYKEKILKEIVIAVCAMLNSNGGKVIICFDTDSSTTVESIPFSQVNSTVIRILEQSIISIIGINQTITKVNFRRDRDSVIIFVKKADTLITNNYNLYLPSQTQVVAVFPSEPLENIKNDIMCRKVIQDPVQLGSHCQIFRKDKNVGFHESKICQAKNLKAEQSKRTTLADRITGKGNKFSCYVSAFANHSGGHIYYGIADEKVVGEFILNYKGKEEITKKVEKAINKMTWPQQISQPKRGEHWEIFFQPVIDETSKPIPSTFVIVIYIASCLGGVFTEEPECYEIVDGKVKKMSFTAWRKRISQPIWLLDKNTIPPKSIARVTWSSPEAQKAFTEVNEELRELINAGHWYAISKLFASLQKQSHSRETELVVLSKQVTACYRRGHFHYARFFLKKYMTILPQVNDILIFEVVGLHIEAGLKRATADIKGLKEALTAALSKAELIEPGQVTATVYAFASTVSDLVSFNEPTNNSSKVFSIRALEHSQHVEHCSRFHVDKAQKAHITLAAFYLGSNLSGQSLKKDNITISDLEKAKRSLMTVYQSICEKSTLSTYREIQLKLVESIYHYRHSQVRREQRVYFLRSAFNHAKQAECLARDRQFKEMLEWSQTNKASYTEELVRANFASIKI